MHKVLLTTHSISNKPRSGDNITALYHVVNCLNPLKGITNTTQSDIFSRITIPIQGQCA